MIMETLTSLKNTLKEVIATATNPSQILIVGLISYKCVYTERCREEHVL
ncbi:MAG: hypothetical protein NTY86_16955 [Deltaproteobacteria bacterium]|nr:hypothetical protein [Deltaproteobacteria bacterium]